MPAPVASARTTPTGFKMPDGYRSVVTFGSKPAVQLWEKEVKSTGRDGGEPIDTTTMHNVNWRTFALRKLKTLMPITFRCAFDPDAMPDIDFLINRNDTITVLEPDGSMEAFFGGMNKFEKDPYVEGQMPMATVTITPTNTDPASGGEFGPVFTAAAGT